MLEKFRAACLKGPALAMVDQANAILDEFKIDRIQLTVRGLHYQFVRRNWYSNTQENYRKLVRVVSEARIGGLLDWSALEDLERTPILPSYFDSKDEFVRTLQESAASFSLDRWQDQPYYVELWVEKKALSGVLRPIAEKWGVGFTMNKGYSSQTALYDAANRFSQHRDDQKRECVMLYVGDHDPSGEDMARDIDDRLRLFRADVDVRKVALTFAQVKQYKCPPNPAKFKDPRAGDYIAKYGKKSWETEALDPKDLRSIVEREIRSLIDTKIWKRTQAQEDLERTEIQTILDTI